MKKLISLLLCLLLCLPAVALGETTEPMKELWTTDFGTFTMGIADGDQYQVAEGQTSNVLHAIIYVDYDPTALTQDNITVIWTTDNIPSEINMVGGMEAYGELVLKNAEPQYTSMGIKMLDAKVVDATFNGNTGWILTSCMMDYTGAGIDLVTPLYQMQMFFCDVQGGHYLFTLTSTSYEGISDLTTYIGTVQFK